MIGSDSSKDNLKNAEKKINEIAAILQPDSKRMGSSAAESQGIAQNECTCTAFYCGGRGSDNVPN